MQRQALVLVLLLTLVACGESPPSSALAVPDAAPTFEPISLIVTPTPFWSVAPLPTAEAARIFKYPSDGRPSLIFVYDDSAT